MFITIYLEAEITKHWKLIMDIRIKAKISYKRESIRKHTFVNLKTNKNTREKTRKVKWNVLKSIGNTQHNIYKIHKPHSKRLTRESSEVVSQ